ncbi:MAG: TRAP transporter large permease subunit [Alphaproteobacteria bacterium]|nr:TRAP transporter large permease subunit [Alphaproteobacteria bacterium]
MSGIEIVLGMFAALLLLLLIRVPIAVAMLLVGMTTYTILSGWDPLLNWLKTSGYYLFSTHSLSVVPLFLLMGQFASKAGMSKALFDAANVWLGHRRGGIAMAAIGGCAGFGAICGSSLATAATMGQVALPELRRHNYSGSLATGALAAGGTLGILIPPSVILVIYAILVEANIATMFLAAFIPGILAAIGYIIAIAVYVRINPEAGPAGEKASAAQRLRSLRDIWAVGLIFLIVIGGIYTGVFTPTEGASFGAIGTGILAFTYGRMRLDGLVECVLGAAEATAMIFLILLGAELFNSVIALSRMPFQAADLIAASKLSPYIILIAMIAFYVALGCVMESLSIILITVPVFYPIVEGLDFGLSPAEVKIWFGILALIVVEVGLITPPVGMNVFIINSMARDIPMLETFKGVTPFLISDIVRVGLLIAFPALTLCLVRLTN